MAGAELPSGEMRLEAEIGQNGWLICDADEKLVFGTRPSAKWADALQRLGISPLALSAESGTA